MSEYLPKDVRDGLILSGSLSRPKKTTTKTKSRANSNAMPRLRVEVGGQSFTILKYSEQGFSVRAEDAPRLPGFVDLYDGAEHLSRCLVVATTEEGGERSYEFKRRQAIHAHAPLDYAPGSEPTGYFG